jgi:hypothetical protein
MFRFCLLVGVLCCCFQELRAEDQSAQDEPIFQYNEPTRKNPDDKAVSFKVEYGQTHASGKSDFMQRSGFVSTGYSNGIDETVLQHDTSYLKTSKGLVDDKRHYYLGYDRYLGGRWWAFALYDWESNKIVGNNFVQLAGAGIKFDFLRNRQWKLNVGAAYLRRAKESVVKLVQLDESGQPVSVEDTVDKEDKVVSIRLKFSYGNKVNKFSLIAFHQPALDKEYSQLTGRDERDFSDSVEASLSHALAQGFTISTAYQYRYDSLRIQTNQPRATEKLIVKLGYEYL